MIARIIECVGVFQIFGMIGIVLLTKVSGRLMMNITQIIGYRGLMIVRLIGQVGIGSGKIIIPIIVLFMTVGGTRIDLVILGVLLMCLTLI